MMNEYRIKEVKPLVSENQNPVFYPQINKEVTKTSGYLWWKKTEEIKEWRYFYRDFSKWNSDFLWTEKMSYTSIVACNTMEEAEAVTKEYETQCDKAIKDFNKKYGAAMSDGDTRYVNIHPITTSK